MKIRHGVPTVSTTEQRWTMAEHIKHTLAELQADIDARMTALAEDKRMVNRLAARIGLPPVYPDGEIEPQQASAVIGRDDFVGQPLMTAMRLYLEKRKLAMPQSAPATVNELYDGLLEGGYEFESKKEENAKRIIRITLTKNSGTFYRVGKAYGLVVWYGPKVQKKVRKAPAEPEGVSDAEAADILADLEQEKSGGQ
jgi:hypothetical protein